MTPIQRVPRYVMLLMELLKRATEDHPQRNQLKKVIYHRHLPSSPFTHTLTLPIATGPFLYLTNPTQKAKHLMQDIASEFDDNRFPNRLAKVLQVRYDSSCAHLYIPSSARRCSNVPMRVHLFSLLLS